MGHTLGMSVFRALRHRDFSLYFFGQLGSMVGTWMQNVALGWWVYRLTGRESMLGLVIFAASAPMVLLSPLGGLAADRWQARRLVMAAQGGLLVQAGAMAALAFAGNTRVEPILLLGVLLGLLSAFDLPGRQVLVAQAVPREDLPNAIALNSALFHGSRIVGPALAGLLLAVGHEGWCFLVNAASYLSAVAALAQMQPREQSGPTRPTAGWTSVLEGFHLTWSHLPIRHLIVLSALLAAFGMPYTALMPAVVKESLRGGPRELGWIMGCSGLGATLGALALASRKQPRGLDRLMLFSGVSFSLFLAAFAHTRILWAAYALMALVSFSLVAFNTANNTLIQLQAPDRLRGRVMAVHGMAFLGAMPLGTLAAGLAAGGIGVAWTLSLGAFVCLMGLLGATATPRSPEEST